MLWFLIFIIMILHHWRHFRRRSLQLYLSMNQYYNFINYSLFCYIVDLSRRLGCVILSLLPIIGMFIAVFSGWRVREHLFWRPDGRTYEANDEIYWVCSSRWKSCNADSTNTCITHITAVSVKFKEQMAFLWTAESEELYAFFSWNYCLPGRILLCQRLHKCRTAFVMRNFRTPRTCWKTQRWRNGGTSSAALWVHYKASRTLDGHRSDWHSHIYTEVFHKASLFFVKESSWQ